MFSDNLIINSLEIEREKRFKNKIDSLLFYFTKETITENYSTIKNIAAFLVDDSLKFIDVFHILIKKYYLCDVAINSDNKELHKAIERKNFDEVHNLLLTNRTLRKELLSNYIKNINMPNNFLAIEKTYDHPYEKVNETLVALNSFYLTERYNDNNKVLKKEL